MSISIHQLSYVHADKEPLFQNINLTVHKGQRMALVGKNGSGKSTLLRIIGGELIPSDGEVVCLSPPYSVPQHSGQFDHLTVAEALGVQAKIKALQAILAGEASEENFKVLDDDWTIEERCLSALAFWKLDRVQLSQPMSTLSGGEKTKVFLSGIRIHQPEIILMDEPTNHLDLESREKLYDLIRTNRSTVLIVSHDRGLLNLMPYIAELDRNTLTLYGGNYSFYKAQKERTLQALQNQLQEKEKEFRIARKIARETMERNEKSSVRGEKANRKKGIPRIALHALQGKAEASTVKLKKVHAEKLTSLSASITELRQTLPDERCMKTNFKSSELHSGKILVTASQINFRYATTDLWPFPLDFQIKSGDRILLQGNNGSGKTTLLNLILGKMKPSVGTLTRGDFTAVYVDQECSWIEDSQTVYSYVQQFNTYRKPEHELKTILARYLFPHGTWDKKCVNLSGGEKIRLLFCCLMVSNHTPDLFILDEPTNNLDIPSVEIITTAIKSYQGTVLLVSHDQHFVKEIKINGLIKLFNSGSVIKI